MSGKFVWVRGLRGPIPEKWPHDMPAGGRVGKTIIKEYDLRRLQGGNPNE